MYFAVWNFKSSAMSFGYCALSSYWYVLLGTQMVEILLVAILLVLIMGREKFLEFAFSMGMIAGCLIFVGLVISLVILGWVLIANNMDNKFVENGVICGELILGYGVIVFLRGKGSRFKGVYNSILYIESLFLKPLLFILYVLPIIMFFYKASTDNIDGSVWVLFAIGWAVAGGIFYWLFSPMKKDE